MTSTILSPIDVHDFYCAMTVYYFITNWPSLKKNQIDLHVCRGSSIIITLIGMLDNSDLTAFFHSYEHINRVDLITFT